MPLGPSQWPVSHPSPTPVSFLPEVPPKRTRLCQRGMSTRGRRPLRGGDLLSAVPWARGLCPTLVPLRYPHPAPRAGPVVADLALLHGFNRKAVTLATTGIAAPRAISF